ncbi:hypothetical protein [Nostoc sp. 'Peltigera malacea cyanobiont' DB3992]|uniref:hypothetical protein n=1 Tax=Nostoc sp. 'Peltigera malacea cyanobiont' DB3992 TaxID=1206980 RepID=UPI00211E454E|nr:hypothetical protein [Nostoc sp. 'Peltigera malacea cyanobiont' DB3992]
MLNLDAIHYTTMQSVPYSYAVIENLLPKAASLELAASFPQQQFRLSTGEGYGHLWSEMFVSNEDIALMYKFCDACGVLVAIAPALSCQFVGAMATPAAGIALHKVDYLLILLISAVLGDK